MDSAFRKISRVASLTGGTKWYLTDDCLLAAKRVMYVAEYRRFYLRDLESIVVWPRRSWRWRVIVPAVALLLLGVFLSPWAVSWGNFTAAAIFVGLGVAWVALELLLGPTAGARIRTTGASVDLPLVSRMRRAQKVLAKINEAVRATRGGIEQPNGAASVLQSPRASSPTISGVVPATATAEPTGASGS